MYRNSVVVIAALCLSTIANAKFSFKEVSSFFGGTPYEEVVYQEYQLDNLTTLSIENIDGPIKIKTGWKKNMIFLKATKKANKEEHLTDMKIHVTRAKDKKLIFKTTYAHDKAKGSIEYELIIPSYIHLRLKTGNGTITVHDVHGPIAATTVIGNIELFNTKNTIYVQSTKNGSITIQNARGPVSVTAHNGNIMIDNAYNSIVASTTKGTIAVACSEVPSTSAIRLETTSGPITIALPSSINAQIKGNTACGTISSDHYITLKPHTTKLNNLAWNRFKKEVNGTLGTGEAEVSLKTTYGNIKVLKTVTA